MNRYQFSQDQVTKDKFPKCKECGGSWIKGHECPGPKVPTYGQEMPAENGPPVTPFQEIWTNANREMLEDEDDFMADDLEDYE